MLRSPAHFLAILVAVASLIGCDSPDERATGELAATRPAVSEHPRPPAIVDPRPAGEADLDEAVAELGTFTFRSWGGLWTGGGADIDLTFLPGRRVELRQYGCFELREIAGSYSIDGSGILTIQFDSEDPFPPMYFLRDRTSLVLLPQDQAKPPSKEVEKFWAYRPLPAQDQAMFKTRL